jgi:hypothetical protein
VTGRDGWAAFLEKRSGDFWGSGEAATAVATTNGETAFKEVSPFWFSLPIQQISSNRFPGKPSNCPFDRIIGATSRLGRLHDWSDFTV